VPAPFRSGCGAVMVRVLFSEFFMFFSASVHQGSLSFFFAEL